MTHFCPEYYAIPCKDCYMTQSQKYVPCKPSQSASQAALMACMCCALQAPLLSRLLC